jgi:hypothetical protein
VPKASKQSASEHEAVEGYEGHFEHFDGGWTVGFEAYSQDADLARSSEGSRTTSASASTWAT